jgi:hypothetical protein
MLPPVDGIEISGRGAVAGITCPGTAPVYAVLLQHDHSYHHSILEANIRPARTADTEIDASTGYDDAAATVAIAGAAATGAQKGWSLNASFLYGLTLGKGDISFEGLAHFVSEVQRLLRIVQAGERRRLYRIPLVPFFPLIVLPALRHIACTIARTGIKGV